MFTTDWYKEDPKLAGQRAMLVNALRGKGITDEAVLQAIGKVPRQLFFPSDFEQFVYRDAAFPIGHGQTISQPFTVAFQSQLLALKPGEKVLEIGTGSGYQAAVLSALGAEVFTVEVIKPLLSQAQRVLKNMDSGMKLFLGDGSLGLKTHAPYDAILVTAGAPDVPQSLLEQLKIGGRLVIPVGSSKENQVMMRIIKTSAVETVSKSFGNFKFVPLVGKEGWE